jgi:2-amino-4-hydroxy-6-hydroxymethyldihydropteridine diphosphokinase
MRLIALGSNLPGRAGGPQAVLEAALEALEARGLRVLARSRWYRTPAVPAGSGPDFVNGAARVSDDMPPRAAMEVLHAVEAALGRERPARWAPRVCDLDLLADGDAVLPDRATVAEWIALDPAERMARAPAGLVLPHPRLHERAFVLAPLAEITPDWVHPVLGLSVRGMLADLPAAARAGIAPL